MAFQASKLQNPVFSAGEYSEIQCCAGAVARLRVSVDDSILMGVGEDGAFFLLDVKDRERAVAIGSGGRREREALPWAEEVLVTKSDLEEKRAKMAELEAQVGTRARKVTIFYSCASGT